MKWVTTESSSYSPPTYCIYHRNSYHLIFMIFKNWNLIFGVCSVKSHTIWTVRAWMALLPHHSTGWMSLELGWAVGKMGAGKRKKNQQTKPKNIHFFLGWKMIWNSWVTPVWTALCSCLCWVPVPLHTAVQVQRCKQESERCNSTTAPMWFFPRCIKDIPVLSQDNKMKYRTNWHFNDFLPPLAQNGMHVDADALLNPMLPH